MPRYMDSAGFPSFCSRRKMEIPAKVIPLKMETIFPFKLPPLLLSKKKKIIPKKTNPTLIISAHPTRSRRKSQDSRAGSRKQMSTSPTQSMAVMAAEEVRVVEVIKQ